MNRRDFITKTSILGSASILSLNGCQMDKTTASKYKLGYQLFSVNDDMNKDPLGTITALKGMGYEDFEIYGFDPDKLTYYGLEARTFKQALDDQGLTATSGHYGFADYRGKSKDEMRRFVDQVIKGAQILNTPYITWPWIAPENRNIEAFKALTPMLNLIGEQIKAAGLGFAYHNHGYEFDDHNGQVAYDIILNETDPDLVKIQIDMYWVMHSSTLTPAEWIAKQPGRFVMWHIKDMDKITRDYTELGNGSINYTKLMPDPVESGLEFYYLEQGGNFTQSAMQSAATSAIYFKEHLQKFL